MADDERKFFRSEWKYLLPDSKAWELMERLGDVFQLDPHAPPGGVYDIHSLYFDDFRNTCAYENLGGEKVRFKYRIRFYQNHTHEIFLERKEKLNVYTRKQSCLLTPDEYSALLHGDAAALVYRTDKPLLRRFCTEMISDGFEPRVIIDYDRKAYMEPITNIRITLDKNVTASNDFDSFLTGDYLRMPVLSEHRTVLEVKFDEVLPGYVQRLIQATNATRQSYSKYLMGRTAIGGKYFG